MKYFLLLFMVCITPLSAKSKVQYPLVYLTWNNDPTTTMTVQWVTSKKDKSNALSYQIVKKAKSKNYINVNGYFRLMPQNEPYIIHRVELDSLEPDTMYEFSLGKEKKTYRFKTMPKDLNSPVRFVVGGDGYSNKLERFRKMCARAGKQNPRFAVMGGDIAYSAPKKKGEDDFYQWGKFLTCWMQEMKDADGCLIPILAGIGNHEVIGRYKCSPDDAPFYYALFERAYYDVSFGTYLHFVFLDSNHTHPIVGNQTFWLDKVLCSHQHFTHKMAICHVGPYPSTGSFKLKIRKEIRAHWVPIFEKYGLNVLFENHDHAYKRTYPLLQGKIDPRGVVYIGDGSWGVNPRKTVDRPYLAHRASEQQVTVVELTKTSRTFYAVNVDGKIIDSYAQPA